jgi:membrane-bound lytic murein transglycosylase B
MVVPFAGPLKDQMNRTPSLEAVERMLVVWAGAVLFVAAVFCPSRLFAAEPLFASLQKRLMTDGLDSQFVQALYQQPWVKLEPEVVAGNLTRSEKTLNYQQFLSPYAVTRAQDYLERHRPALLEAEQRFGVPPQVVVAILMVETALGTYTGKYLTINVLSTMAAARELRVREAIFASLNSEARQTQSGELISMRLATRAARSYVELKALVRYLHKNNIDPSQLMGSSEGAIGIPQFMPSNVDRYAQDGDADGRIDLLDHEDAIASVASFLQAHKWSEARGVQEKKRVLLHYNRSIYYVDTVYSLAELLDSKASETRSSP